MNGEKDRSIYRLTLAQCIGTLLFVVAIETGLVSRPVAFLVGPFLVWFCMLVAAPAELRTKWKRTLFIAAACSAIGYLIFRYVVRS